MTLPGEPKIKINPSQDERATLPEWLEVQEDGNDYVTVRYMSRSANPPYVLRTDRELEPEETRMLAAAMEQMTEDDWKSAVLPKGYDLVTGTIRIHRRDACTLADHIAAFLWKAEDAEDTANQADDVERAAKP